MPRYTMRLPDTLKWQMLRNKPRKDLYVKEQQAAIQVMVIRTAASLASSSQNARTLVGVQQLAPHSQNDSKFDTLNQFLLCNMLATVQSVPGNPDDWAYRPPDGC